MYLLAPSIKIWGKVEHAIVHCMNMHEMISRCKRTEL